LWPSLASPGTKSGNCSLPSAFLDLRALRCTSDAVGDPPHLEPVLVETQVFVFFVLDFVLDFCP
jgi:hypothetical protein